MAFNRTFVAAPADRAAFDAGLRAHMQSVFNYMGGGVALSGALAWIVANTPLGALIFGTPLAWVVMLAPLGFIFYLNYKIRSISVARAQTLFWIFCGLMGLSMGAVFMVFTQESIARAFFITAATFAAMSLWGYTTKRDLSGFGAIMIMGVMGVFIAMLVNMGLAIFTGAASSMLQWVISVVGVLVFTGLTAFDVQRIKQTYAESWGVEANQKMAVMGALGLYLNFINAFQFLLSLMGSQR
ncbi:MAG: BAX inhibitor (BI)-1/YccA family protein [Alphaproteobacteria bacterium]|nr:BAX inhibitor (BI)-1/YccA family protein [Alphaproteobacteria bacterium]